MSRTQLAAVLAVALSVFAQPLAAAIILPGILGTVYHDADGSGTPSPSEGIAGVTLQLFQDNGDGVFDPDGGDAPVLTYRVTGADGMYAFESLEANASYFVQRSAVTQGGSLLPATVSGLLRPSDMGLLIDSFENNQAVKANPTVPTATSTLSDPMSSILGSERDLYVRLISGVGEVQFRSNAFGVAVLQYDTTSGVSGQGIVTWDGIDTSASPIPSLGLGDMDLTEGGFNEGLYFRLGIDATGANELLRVRLFDESTTEYSEATLPMPVTDGTATESAYLPFSDFVGPVSPSKVNAIQLILGEGARSVDAQLKLLRAIAPVVQDFEVVPEPAGILLAFLGLGGLWRGAHRRR